MTTEDLYKNSFDGFQQDPPPGVWKGVNRRLAIKSFLTPGLGHFNILYVAAAAAIIVGVFLSSPDDNKQPVQDNQTVTLADSSTDGTRQNNGNQLYCNKCKRSYDVNNGVVANGTPGIELYRYKAALDGGILRVWN